MALSPPIIYKFTTLGETLDHLYDAPNPSCLLIFCGSRDTFAQRLSLATTTRKPDEERPETPATSSPRQPLNTRTLRRIARAEAIKIAFCTSVPALHAYLSTLPKEVAPNESTLPSLLVLVDAVSLHQDTASFSAQGLSRAFAAAFEAALRSRWQLVVVEHPKAVTGRRDVDVEIDDAGGRARMEDPWEREVPMLNATTRTFGVGGASAVLGRTVKVRAVAERWCTFESVVSCRD